MVRITFKCSCTISLLNQNVRLVSHVASISLDVRHFAVLSYLLMFGVVFGHLNVSPRRHTPVIGSYSVSCSRLLH
jgi:hypothetical protein